VIEMERVVFLAVVGASDRRCPEVGHCRHHRKTATLSLRALHAEARIVVVRESKKEKTKILRIHQTLWLLLAVEQNETADILEQRDKRQSTESMSPIREESRVSTRLVLSFRTVMYCSVLYEGSNDKVSG
jgi:hypothetical protein